MSYVQKFALTLVAASVFGVVEALIFFLAETFLVEAFFDPVAFPSCGLACLVGDFGLFVGTAFFPGSFC